MAVEDFIPLSDVKQTTEKEVPRKPSIEELTTIDSPGRPSPASFLEEKPKKRKSTIKKTKKAKAEPSSISLEKEYILIITEKPQAALKIATALGNPEKNSIEGVPYYELTKEGEKIIVASAVGHLFNLTYVKGQKGWPIFEVEWQPSYEKKTSAFTRRYYEVLKKLSRKAKEFVIATDYDVEGEVIGWNVLRFICKQKNAKRMKFSTLTSEELKKSFENSLPELNWGNAYAGETRHFIDWLYGINLSRALMSAIKTSNLFRILSIGRVQGPALKIIVDREREISSFKPVPYWNIYALSNDIEFRHPKDVFDEKELEKFKGIKEANAKTEIKKESIEPPHPFDLTTLQREAYRLFKMNPSETLKVAQKLYLDGVISYPRTSSQKIPKEIEPKKILKKLEKQFPEIKQAIREDPIEGKKSDPAHPSIYPTGEMGKLGGSEAKLYDLIVRRFISSFSPDAIVDNKKITLTAGDINFIADGLKIIEKGWNKVYPIKMEENDLPDINGKVKIDKIDTVSKETQPPHRYTPTSLISTLEKKNLGTKATRSSIVDTLFDRGYLDGTSIKATPLGLKLIESLEKYSPIIIDENLTRQLEEELEEIQTTKGNLEDKEKQLIDKVKRVITDISKEFKAKEVEIGRELASQIEELRRVQQQSNILMPCHVCKQGNLRIMYNKASRRYFLGCSNYPNCKQTYSLPPNALIKKAETQCEADHFPKLLAIRKARRPWEFCFNPDCPIEKAKREKYQSQKSNQE